MQDRKKQILKAIVQHFIDTAEPVGSNTILVSYKFSVSPATIRNDMAYLEKEGLVFQPHTSSGRVPTDTGYRLYVDEMADYKLVEKEAIEELEKVREAFLVQKMEEKIFDAVRLLSQATHNVSFATLPGKKRTFFLGISNVLKQPEFKTDSIRASEVLEVLENDNNFINTLNQLDIDESIKIFIGKENIIKEIQSCSILVTKYNFNGFEGFIGILGPTRMKYPYNSVILREIKKMLTD